jgi:hypothetical protein
VLLSGEFHGAVDAWTEHLCLEVRTDGRVELSSRSRELLMGYGWEAGEVVWPEGYDPEHADNGVLPLSVGGKAVAGTSGDFIVGENLVPHVGGSTAVFDHGQTEDARSWLASYGWWGKPGIEDA